MHHKIIIIGAGVAGISAGLALQEEAEEDFIILEAADDVGGRVRTFLSKSGKPHELGAAFLHSHSENPFAQWLLERGGRLAFLEPTEHICIHGKWLDETGIARFSRNYDDIKIRADILLGKNANAAADELLTGEAVYDAAALAFAGPTETGAELSELSLLDVADQIELGENAILKGSIQQMLRDAAMDLPLELETKVTAIDYSGDEIQIKTSRGDFSCDQLIITCPVDILLDDVSFTPALPDEKRNALTHLRQGLLNKLVLKYSDQLWPFGESFYAFMVSETFGPAEIWMMPHAPSTLYVLYGGARKQMSYADFKEHFLPALSEILPALPENLLDWQQSTHWQDESFAHGSYSVLRPGCADARQTYSQPLDGRIFFAGEAADNEWATQMPGAFLAGKQAAELVLQGK